MTRQAAPPVQRWPLLLVVLLVSSWLGQGVARASTISVSPRSGPPGSSVSVTVTDFLEACVVLFDLEVVTIGVACVDATMSFTVPSSATVGAHQIKVVGQAGEDTAEQSAPFTVTGEPSPPAPTDGPPTTVALAPDEASGSPPTTVADAATTASSSPQGVGQPATNAAGTSTGPTEFAAACPPRQVALMRFALRVTHGRPGTSIPASTSWGLVGTCTEVRPLAVLIDGRPVPIGPLAAGTSAAFDIEIPKGARAGSHRVALVAADDESVELASQVLEVDGADGLALPVVAGLVAAGVLLVGLVVGLVARRKRGRRRFVEGLARGEVEGDEEDDHAGWSAFVDVPDIAAAVEHVPAIADEVREADVAEVLAVDDEPTMPVVPLVVTSGRDGSFYLLERQNPHAPRRPNGKRGWYRDTRTAAVRGIVGQTVEPHTAGAAASELAIGEAPSSAHVVIDVDGALELLPDDIVVMHRPEHDAAALVMLIAGFGVDPTVDELILAHAAAWSAAKMREHGIPARRVRPEEFEAGEAGLLLDDPIFPWRRLLTLIAPLVEPPEVSGPAEAVAPGEPEVTVLPEDAGVPGEATEAAITEVGDSAVADALLAGADEEPEGEGAPVSGDPGEAATQAPAAPTTPPPTPAAPRSPRAPARRRPLPTPDERIARVVGDTAYYLLENENPNGTLRANGKHGWYYPTRYGGIRAVVLHSVRRDGIDTAVEAAAYLATVDQPEAAHAAVDPDTIVDLLPDETTALHGVRSSSAALDLAVVYDPNGWGSDAAAEEALLVRAAAWTGVRAVRHRIPVRRITVDEWHSGERGIAAHGDTDPGPDFPWDRFLQLTTWVARRVAATRPAATGPSETARSGIQPT